MEKKNLGLILILVSIVLAMGLVVATHTSTQSIRTFPESTSTRINITVNNSDINGAISNITIVNITLPSGFVYVSNTNGSSNSSAYFSYTAVSKVLSWNMSQYGYSLINGTDSGALGYGSNASFWFNVTSNMPGTYNISVKTYNNTAWFEQNLTFIVNDTTNPSFIDFGANMLANYTNSTSTSIVFNFTALDNGVIDSIVLRLYNSTGLYNATEINGTNSEYSGSMEGTWISLPNEVYYINATVNDTFGFNLTTYTKKIIVDNVAPVISHACSSTAVSKGASLSCTCSATDTYIKTTEYTGYPSTATAGTFTTTCTATDYAGNSATDTITYTVTGGGASSPSGSSGGSSSLTGMTYSTTTEQVSAGFTKTITTKDRIKARVANQDHYVSVKEISGTTSATIVVESTPQEVVLNVGETKKFELTGDNTYDLAVTLNSITGTKADVKIISINEEIPQSELDNLVSGETESTEVGSFDSTASTSSWKIVFWITLAILLIVIGVWYYYNKRR